MFLTLRLDLGLHDMVIGNRVQQNCYQHIAPSSKQYLLPMSAISLILTGFLMATLIAPGSGA